MDDGGPMIAYAFDEGADALDVLAVNLIYPRARR
jgi:hypothetical protein